MRPIFKESMGIILPASVISISGISTTLDGTFSLHEMRSKSIKINTEIAFMALLKFHSKDMDFAFRTQN